MTFGQRLKAARKRAKLRQEDVARKLGIHYTTVSKWENDGASPDRETSMMLAEMFGVSVGFLFGTDDDEKLHPEILKAIKGATERQQKLILDFLTGKIPEEVFSRKPNELERAILRDVEHGVSIEELAEKYPLYARGEPATLEDVKDMVDYLQAKRIMRLMNKQ